jgi:tetratricopeptide (TPR) repeat protein
MGLIKMHKMSSKISEILTKEQKAAKEFIEKKKEDFEMRSWLNKAKTFEAKKEYRKALDAYLKFLEIKLKVIKERPEHTLKSYFALIPYYIKIAECYQKTKHLKPEDRIIDMEKAAKFYQKAAEMSMEEKKYNQAHSYYEESSRAYQEIEEYDNAAMSYVHIAKMYLNIKSILMASSAYVKAGQLYEKGMNFEQAALMYKKVALLNLQIKNPRDASLYYGKAGDCYQKLRKYGEGIKLYLEASHISSKLERYQEVAELNGKIAQAYEKLKDYENGIHYYLKSIELGNDEVKKSSYGGAARCYEKLKSYEQSIEYYKKAADISAQLKQNLDAALFSMSVGRCYEKIGDYEKAAKFYFQYGEFGSLENDKESLKGYEKASQLYIKIAKKFVGEKKIEEGIKNYQKAAESYERIQEYQKAAEIFREIAELEFTIDHYDKGMKAYFEAAKFYEQGGNLYDAALSYERAEDYKKAADLYLRYASQQEKREKNLFLAGNGIKKAAECYEKLKDVAKSKANYAKAIHTYLKHIDSLKYIELNKKEVGNEGDANRNVAECYLSVRDMPNAKKYFEKALSYYEKNKNEKEIILTKALLLRVNADLAVRQGDYENASKFLTQSITLLEESIKEGNFIREYVKFLEKHKSQEKDLLREISKKPEVTLLLDRHSYTFVNTPVVINALIINQGDQEVHDLEFLSHIPDELEVTISPVPIKNLKPGETFRNSLELVSQKVGEYRVRPLEVYYHDEEGNNYVKSSNNITLKVVKKPSMDYKDYRITVNSFLEYAETQLKNKNYFHAGEGYRGVAQTYERFNEDIASRENYEKAIENYLKHIDFLLKENLDVAKLHMLGDTYKRIGECFEKIGSLEDSEKYYAKGIEYYEKTKAQVTSQQEKLKINYQIISTSAFLKKVQAKFAIKHGDYEKGNSLLEESIELIDEAIKKGDFSKEYEEFLEKNQREGKALMKEIKGKPAIDMKLTYKRDVIEQRVSQLIVEILNKWDKPIYDLRFLIKLPQEIELKEQPKKIEKLKPQESNRIFIELIPKTSGEYKFKPFDLIYRDEKGDNYMKGCDQIILKVKKIGKESI